MKKDMMKKDIYESARNKEIKNEIEKLKKFISEGNKKKSLESVNLIESKFNREIEFLDDMINDLVYHRY